MRSSVRNVLGLAAATAVIAIGLPAVTSSASAATLTSASSPSYDYSEPWGPYYSKTYHGYSAKARGLSYDDQDGFIHVSGKLWDKHSPRWLAAYVEVKFENQDGDEELHSDVKNGDRGYRSFDYTSDFEDNVDTASVRVCYWDNHQDKRKYCGKWNYVYESDSSN